MPYTLEEAKKIMRETQRILDKDARLGRTVTAQAAKRGATPPTAREVYFTYIGEAMDRGLTKREAMAELAGKRPDLHKAFVLEEQKKRESELQREREEAARFRSRNDN